MSEPGTTPSTTGLPTGTVTFLFSDIEGSTKLLQSLGPQYPALLSQHSALIREAVASNGGTEVATEGDSFFVVFPSAPAAAAAALRAQMSLESAEWPEGVQVRVRMGLHTGEGTPGGDNYIGLDVHRAARIAAAGHGGQVLLSDATRALAEASLPEGAVIQDLGEHRLKDLIRPERIYQLSISGLPADFAPLKSFDARPNNLPLQITSFIGRQKVIDEISELVRVNRLVTLSGPGGTGKTRISIQAATNLLPEFKDGTFFIALAPITDPALVPSTIAEALSIKEEGDRPVIETLSAFLESKEILLVFDNFEQVIPGASYVSTLLSSAPNLKVLATSREVLHLSGEQDYPVPPLELPDPKHLPSLEKLSQFEAVALFIQRATSVEPSFAVTNQNAPAVAEICARLDGLPLAIELAAARVKLLTPELILQKMEKSLALLSGGARDLPARQQTLRNAIGWSYDLLDTEEQTLFRRLSMFVGGWTIDAAEAVCNPDDETGVDTLSGLSSLADKSLIKKGKTTFGELRFLMLETIREYGREMLHQGDDVAPTAQRHAAFFLELAEAARPNLTSMDSLLWLDRLDRELDNIRTSLRWMIDHDSTEQALRAGAALWRFWQLHNHLAEGRGLLEEIVALPGPRDRLRADAANALGSIIYWQNDFEAAGIHYKTALEIFEQLGDERGVADTLYNLTWLSGATRNYEEGIRLARESRKLFAKLDAPLMVAWSEFITAGQNLHVFMEKGEQPEDSERLQEADRSIGEAMNIFEKLGDRFGRTHAVSAKGSVEFLRGNYEEARVLFLEALDSFLETQETWGVSVEIQSLAEIEYKKGRTAKAIRLWGASDAIRDMLGGGAPPALSMTTDPRDELRETLPPEQLRAWELEGYAMTVDRAVEYARGDED